MFFIRRAESIPALLFYLKSWRFKWLCYHKTYQLVGLNQTLSPRHKSSKLSRSRTTR
ncbi:hypothetical protein [Moraxella lacunata]|uniref:hypothetical protein n=1 Tax=Moraxella lacunata TaxID=477 RepID=UPI003EE1FD34